MVLVFLETPTAATIRDVNAHRKHVWPWIAVLLIGLPILYVGSFGPACWLTAASRGMDPLRSIPPSPGMIAYWPLGRMASNGPLAVMTWLRWWMYFGAKRGAAVRVPTDLNGNSFGLSLE